MQIKIFTLPAIQSDVIEEEANKFLRSHRVMTIDREFCAEHGGYWTLFITYQEHGGQPGTMLSRSGKVDYREVLPPEQFARFARFREIRKELAARDAIPAYAVFTDEELSQIAQMEDVTMTAIAAIKGVGKRAEKYGAAFLNVAQHEES